MSKKNMGVENEYERSKKNMKEAKNIYKRSARKI